jgi:HD-GYP domain-containing protein (c-di-GMP phosphodiesterase class II)
MTGPTPPRPTQAQRALEQPSGPRPSQLLSAIVDAPEGADLKRLGRVYVLAFAGALRNLKLYPVENAAVQKGVLDLVNVTSEVLKLSQELDLRLSGDALFMNGSQLRLEADNFASFKMVADKLRANGVGELHLEAPPLPRDYIVLLSTLQQESAGPRAPEERLDWVLGRLADAGVRGFLLAPPGETGDERRTSAEKKAAAKRVYAQGIAVTKDVVNSVRMGRASGLKRVKRVVQTIVDQILADETSLVGLTTIRDYDEYTFVHSLNVCIFSVALGRRLGLDKLQLYDLGMSALFHDIGKARIPLDVLNKTEKLSEEEWRLLTTHTWRGLLSLLQFRASADMPYRSMVVAYEHHMRHDQTGYPRVLRERALSIFSKIVAIADGFDAATTQRAYANPVAPAIVLQEMRDNPRRGMDPTLVKAFVAMLGIYPVGTLVMLDTFELAVVQGTDPDPEMASRPRVLIVSDAQGNVVYPGIEVALSDRNADGTFPRTIIKTENPERYGIRIGDYFR